MKGRVRTTTRQLNTLLRELNTTLEAFVSAWLSVFFLSTLYLANKIEVTLHVNLFFWNHTHAQKKGAHDCNRIEEKKRWEILEWWEKRTKTKESIRWYVYWPFFFFSFESSKKHFAIPFILFFSRTANGFFFVGLFLGSNWQEALQLCWRISPPL